MKCVWLSYPLGLNDPRPPAIPAPELSDFLTIEKDGASVQMLRAANHTGTHLDTAGHVITGGISITSFSPEDLIFTRIAVIDLKKNDSDIVMPEDLIPFEERLKNADMAIFRFGYGQIRHEDPKRYSERSPGFGIESAKWFRCHCLELGCIGMDTPSLATIACLDDTMKAHNVLLEGNERKFLVIEEMKLIPDLKGLCEVRINPWLVSGMNSGPCSIVGVLK